ncbi:BCCT family transporter [Ammoniphilus sp. 3BR4]|uniref:BCCT family transporter n=1 Tax=Ammoniphilus sp. 3BR4 TaxID=3158265 RepID=UPI0034660F19
MSIVFVLWGALSPENLKRVMNVWQSFFLVQFGWFYQLSATFFLFFALFLIFSRYGKIKLGKDEDKPDFSRPTWFAMLFSAGMGITKILKRDDPEKKKKNTSQSSEKKRRRNPKKGGINGAFAE